MMNKNFKTNRTKIIIGLTAIIPLFTILVIMHSCDLQPDISTEDEKTITAKKDDSALDTVYTIVSQNPEFPGGVEKMYEFLRANLVYPEAARELGIQGTVFISFIVKADGYITDIEIVRGINPNLDHEALRVMELMPKWEPGKLESGERVNVRFNLPIRFNLGEEKPETESVSKFDKQTGKFVIKRENKPATLVLIDGKPIKRSEAKSDNIDDIIPFDDLETIKMYSGDDENVESFGYERVMDLRLKKDK